MKTSHDLKAGLQRIDGKGYKAYKTLTGWYRFSGFELGIDHVQGDPFSTPSRLRVRVERPLTGFGPSATRNRSCTVALRDYMTRRFFDAAAAIARGERGLGNSGIITVERPGQAILERSAAVVDDRRVEVRLFLGLPAEGRRIAAKEAAAMLLDELPAIVAAALFAETLDTAALERHLAAAEDADTARSLLDQKRLVAFVADGALLPRASGIDPRPLTQTTAVPFESPERYAVTLPLPNAGRVRGMGIPCGVSLIVGGGYHGKSTLLKALETGVYNHIPGDGRELTVTVPGAVKIRAADGRSICHTDISPFINNLPFNDDTASFSTANASGSTSQAAAISEAIEAGARLLLLDEDTSATNFMIRDRRMQTLVSKADEPITPFIDTVRPLFREKGISTVLVMGGSGDYFAVADHVVQMTAYRPADVTAAAREIAARSAEKRLEEGDGRFGRIRRRAPRAEGFQARRENGRLKMAARGPREILFGAQVIDCGDVEQIAEIAQTRAVAHAIRYAARYMDGRTPLKAVLDRVMADIDRDGLDILPPYLTGDLARFREFELAAAINRMRSLSVVQI